MCGRAVEPVWIGGVEYVNTCRLGWLPRSAAQWYLRAWWADGNAWEAMRTPGPPIMLHISALLLLAELLVIALVLVLVSYEVLRGLRRG